MAGVVSLAPDRVRSAGRSGPQEVLRLRAVRREVGDAEPIARLDVKHVTSDLERQRQAFQFLDEAPDIGRGECNDAGVRVFSSNSSVLSSVRTGQSIDVVGAWV